MHRKDVQAGLWNAGQNVGPFTHVCGAGCVAGRALFLDRTGRGRSGTSQRTGMSVIELLLVMIFMAIVATFAMPRLNLRGVRIDASAREVTMTMMSAQRLAIQKQHNVVVA
jgi:hypothetical protein